ncbi:MULTISPECIES: TVP38/TMEM64 family protein [unclassified Paenibacillus]|uniref:TVP38/TMEM64 family protein n=1 Tax=unclassified Paenibacillus TaxID=185978 RepID=UPI001C101BD4|nr:MULTISPECIES: TVP38/TMEM64 family protein [unclassified Paenibacillus]MBU5442362.1 TVP38/TMEM64 family protein [Paenibacillus sp. MSJ-34]CAH0121624.1 TVP38/TMEM64 family inner membrane protein YdjZ [Paenibacillus sp. CECT 9249]
MLIDIDFKSVFTEQNIFMWLEQYRSYGPLPGILLTFLKSFVPPLPTIVLVGANAAAYGLWLGFLYSWIGIVAGCLASFLIIRKIAGHRFIERWSRKPKVQKSMVWIRRNAFSYVFVLSIFPVGPFVLVNAAAAVAKMSARSFLVAIVFGKAIMVFTVSLIGHDISQFIRYPEKIVYVLLFLFVSWFLCKKIESRLTRQELETRSEAQG